MLAGHRLKMMLAAAANFPQRSVNAPATACCARCAPAASAHPGYCSPHNSPRCTRCIRQLFISMTIPTRFFLVSSRGERVALVGRPGASALVGKARISVIFLLRCVADNAALVYPSSASIELLPLPCPPFNFGRCPGSGSWSQATPHLPGPCSSNPRRKTAHPRFESVALNPAPEPMRPRNERPITR